MTTALDRATLDRVYRYCQALAGNRDDAYDLLQDAVESYLVSPAVRIDQPVAYLFRIARNRFIDQQRRAGVVAFETLEDPDSVAGVEAELEKVVIDRDELERVWVRLTVPEREVLFLWAVEGMTAAEIARRLDQPRATILSRLRRARLRMQADSPARNASGGVS